MLDPVGYQRLAHAKHCIGIQIGVAVPEHMGNQALIAGSFDHEVQMGRPPGMIFCRLQHAADGAVNGNGIGLRQNGLEVKTSLSVGMKNAARLRMGQIGVLHVIVAIGIGLPHVDERVGHWFAIQSFDSALDHAGLTYGTVGHVITEFVARRIFHEKGAKHRCLCATQWLVVVHGYRQHGQTKGVAKQDELLTLVIAHLAGGRQKLNAFHPFGFGQLYLTGKGMKVLHQGCQDFFQASIGRARKARNHGLGYGVLVQIAHSSVLRVSSGCEEYTQRYPNVTVHIEAANRYLDIIDNNIDVAIRTREVEPDSNITIRRLAETRRILAASPRYFAQHGFPKTLEDLQRHKLLIYTYANNPNELRFTRDGESTTITAKGLLESNDGQILRAAALDGLGILVQPTYIL